MKFKDKVVIVTGAGAGIGKSTVLHFAKAGARVVAVDINGERAEKAAMEIKQDGGEALSVQADISREEQARRITDEATQAYGRVDILVNNAATFVLKGFSATVSEWQQSLGVNVVGTAMVTKYAVDSMKRNGGGAIVNLGSISSWIAQPDLFAYSATKAAILQMTRNMALDLARYHIRVNCVCPGSILTDALSIRVSMEGKTLEQFSADEGAKTPLKRIGRPGEVAQAILFLASDEASYITGTSLMVDGGYTAV